MLYNLQRSVLGKSTTYRIMRFFYIIGRIKRCYKAGKRMISHPFIAMMTSKHAHNKDTRVRSWLMVLRTGKKEIAEMKQ